MMAFAMVSEDQNAQFYLTVDFGIPDHTPDRLRASHSHRGMSKYKSRRLSHFTFRKLERSV